MLSTRIGKYTLLKWVGGGAFGDVYLAQDNIIKEKFALKVSRLSEKDLRLLSDEARLLSRLFHPNIVRFYNIDLIDGRLVMVMEYIEGESLRKRMNRGKPSVNEALSITLEVLSALSYAHNKNIIHRDIKPENILIDTSGKVKLTDFGLATFIKEGTISQSMAGTPAYIPPEGWNGRFVPQSDIYSTGVVLYEMLTGVNPFVGNSLEDLRKNIFDRSPSPPDVLNRDVSKGLSEILLKAISKKIRDRFSSCEEFHEMLLKTCGLSVDKTRKYVEVHLPEEKEEFHLTELQKEIVTSSERKILVEGGAGTGKTTALIYRACYFIRDLNIQPQKILITTFTRKAIRDIKERMEKILKTEMRDIMIDNVHGLGLRILRKYGWILNFPEDFVVEPITQEHTKRFFKEKTKFPLKRLLREVEKLKRKLIYPENFSTWVGRSQVKLETVNFFNRLRGYSENYGILSYDDLLYWANYILDKNKDIEEELRNNFEAVLIDELQDLNLPQYVLLKKFISNNTLLFATGDRWQNIYSWRGGSSKFIQQIQRDFRDIKLYRLNVSFRVPEKILKVSKNLMRKTSSDIGVTATLVPEEGGIELFKAKNETDEANFVVERTKELVASDDVKFSDICVLFRMNYYSRPIEDSLSSGKIPYTLIGTYSFYEREEVVILLNLLKSLIRRDIKSLVKSIQILTGARKLIEKLSGIKDVEKVCNEVPLRYKKLFEYAKEVFSKAEDFSAYEVLSFFLDESKYLEKLKRKKSSSAITTVENTMELLQASKEFKGNLQDFLDHLGLMEDLDMSVWNKNAVKLMTIHSAKGLEFPVVFITGLAEGIFPAERSTLSSEELEEERRLLYVASTRARKKLILTFPSRRRYQTLGPSRFLLDMVLK